MPRPKNRRRSSRAAVMPRSIKKHCDTCLSYEAVDTFGNRSQAQQAANVKHPGDENITFCTNSNGGVHIVRVRPVVVVPDE